MNNKKTIARVGNFIVTKENGNGMDWVSIKAVSGFWTMRFRQDNMMFRMVNEMAGDENLHAYLESWVKMCYLMSNCMPDLDFMEEFYKSYSDWSERQAKSEEVLSDEEDAKILEEERRKWEMKNELSGMNDGKGEYKETPIPRDVTNIVRHYHLFWNNIRNFFTGIVFFCYLCREPK